MIQSKRSGTLVVTVAMLAGLTFNTLAQSNTVTATANGNAIDVTFQGQVRLKGGIPKIEKVDLPDKLQATTKNTFTFGTPAKAVTLSIKKSAYTNIVGLYLASAGVSNVKANEFQGFFFSAIPGYKEGVAFYRYKPWNSWTKPVKVSTPGALESWDNQCFYWRYTDGLYGLAVPISDQGYRTTLGSEQGAFGSKAVSNVDNYHTESIPAFVVGFGDDLYTLLANAYETAMTFSGSPENVISKKKFPEPLSYIGWCTWNASSMGSKLNEETVTKGVESFTKNNFPLGWVLVDDGWFDHKNSQLRSFSPDATKFPNGFKPLVAKLKNDYHIKHVGIWHAFNGYWNGIDPTSPLGERYKNEMFSWDQRERVDAEDSPVTTYHFIKPSSDSLTAFYNTFHAYFKREGISFIKVDNQLSVERMSKQNFPIGDMARKMHSKLNASAKKYFDNAMINCMDMTADAYFNFGATSVARSVEDYFPYEKGETYNLQRGNAAAHILQGIYNNLYFSQMVFPDLDMFQSHNPNGEYHAIARAINNGPIYVTDNPGEQNFEILNRLVLSDGKILRADQPLLPTQDCLFQVQDEKLFKAFSRSKNIGLIGVWNAADADSVSGSISPADANLNQDGKYALYEAFSGKVSIIDHDAKIPVSLKRMKYQLYYVAPLRNGMLPLGILDKYNAPATISTADVFDSYFKVVTREAGKFGAVLPRKPKKVFINGKAAPKFNFADNLFTVQIAAEKNVSTFEVIVQL